MTNIIRRYTFKLYPSAQQADCLHTQRQMMADLWNALLQRREDVYRRERRTLSRFDLEYEITSLYRECPEWRALSTWCGRRVNVALSNAFDAFFRRAKQGAGAQSGYPRYKRRRDGDRIPHRCASGCRLSPRERSDGETDAGSARNWCLTLKGVPGVIHARGIFPSDPEKFTDADVLWRDGRWWLSICVEMPPRRFAGSRSTTVNFGSVGDLARVNAEPETPAELVSAQLLQDRVDTMKAERDRRWPRRAPDDQEWCEANNEISRLSARVARKRRNALHVWSARLVRLANDLTIITPPIKDSTSSPRGDAREWGAAVDAVSTLNRSVLSMAPATAAAMLAYKAEEAGIRCDVVADAAPEIAIGGKLVAAGKQLRKAKRAMKGKDHEHNQQGTGGTGRGDRGRVSVGA